MRGALPVMPRCLAARRHRRPAHAPLPRTLVSCPAFAASGLRLCNSLTNNSLSMTPSLPRNHIPVCSANRPSPAPAPPCPLPRRPGTSRAHTQCGS